MGRLEGKVAFVTGGARGIGRAIVEKFAAEGADVTFADVDGEAGRRAVDELSGGGVDAKFVRADVTSEPEVQHAIESVVARRRTLDILVNNAGINIRKQPQEYTLEEWSRVLASNLTSAFIASQAAYAHFKRAGAGKIVNLGSMMSLFGASFAGPYGASKGGIVQLTRSLACAWAKDNIQVNAVLPGWIDTALTQKARVELTGLNERVLSRTPAGRWGEPADMAGIAVFLASPAADFITGAAIPVDGGYSSQG